MTKKGRTLQEWFFAENTWECLLAMEISQTPISFCRWGVMHICQPDVVKQAAADEIIVLPLTGSGLKGSPRV